MLHKTHGIVFSATKFRETSLIVKIYTKDFGLQSYIVKGVRSPGAKSKASFFQSLNMLEMEVYRRENKNFQYLRDFRMAHIFKSLPFDVVKSSIAIFLLEVLNNVIMEEESNEQLYQFLEHEIISLDESSGADNNFHIRFLISMTRFLGFYPLNGVPGNSYFDLKEGKFTAAKPPHQFYIGHPYSKLLSGFVAGERRLAILAEERGVLLEKLLQYYQLHISGFRKIKSHKILHEVLSV